MLMRTLFIALAGAMLFTGHAAQAKVDITVDKNNQMMTVAVDGVERYHWPVSTGIPSRETPTGSFRAFRMEQDHYSKEFDDAPMPNSIFFTKIGHAIHGTESEGRLGTPASHGCVRLSKAHAATLYALVQQQGVLNTNVTLTGSAAVALARNPRGTTALAGRQRQTSDQQYASGDPVVITPQAQVYSNQQVYPNQQTYPNNQQIYPNNEQIYSNQQQQVYPNQRRPDDGYIYPADGSTNQQIYPAPRTNRRVLDAQVTPQQQPRTYNNQGYAPAPQGYYTQQRPQYYQQPGYYQ
jgi:L,D-transpeptidase catalytic domain